MFRVVFLKCFINAVHYLRNTSLKVHPLESLRSLSVWSKSEEKQVTEYNLDGFRFKHEHLGNSIMVKPNALLHLHGDIVELKFIDFWLGSGSAKILFIFFCFAYVYHKCTQTKITSRKLSGKNLN